MPTTRYGMAAAVINGIVHVAGGVDNGANRENILEAYDPVANSWSTKADMTIARQGAAAAGLGGKLYVMGGTSGVGGYAVVEAYDPATNTWSEVEPMGSTRVYPGAATLGGLIYAMGGYPAS